MKVVCLGDSLTGPAPGAAYRDKFLKWTDLLQFGLETILGVGKVEVLNQGKAGDTSDQVCQDLEERMLRHRPDAVVVLLGANNYSPQNRRAETAERFRKDLLEIVGKAREVGAKVLLLQYPDPKAEDMSRVWVFANEGNPVIAEVARTEKGAGVREVALLSLREAFLEAEKKGMALAELVSPVDGIHLNPGGELVVARAVVRRFWELGWV